MKTSYFHSLGAFDEGMEDYGAENVEMSFRVSFSFEFLPFDSIRKVSMSLPALEYVLWFRNEVTGPASSNSLLLLSDLLQLVQ